MNLHNPFVSNSSEVGVNTVWLNNSTPKYLPQRNTCSRRQMGQNVNNRIVWKDKTFGNDENDHEQKNR